MQLATSSKRLHTAPSWSSKSVQRRTSNDISWPGTLGILTFPMNQPPLGNLPVTHHISYLHKEAFDHIRITTAMLAFHGMVAFADCGFWPG
jgi:hypothetical protein